MKRTLIIGYGNVDREDDGVAWHILVHLAERLGREIPLPEVGFGGGDGDLNPSLTFALQLTPEMAEDLSTVERVVFIDAAVVHPGSNSEEIQAVPVESEFQASPLTHHLTPSTLLALCESLYRHSPQALLVSVHGYHFGFSRALSPGTAALVEPAAGKILEWLMKLEG